MNQIRIGQGYDVHILVKGRPLILGGVPIPFEKGLQGHSDADVLVHAVCDALLGALGLGDLGQHFPDTDKAYQDVYSIDLLETCCEMMAAQGYGLINMDATVFAQEPKIAPYRDAIQEKLALTMGVALEQVNIKATTTEGLGYIGAGDGMAAMCVVLIGQKSDMK